MHGMRGDEVKQVNQVMADFLAGQMGSTTDRRIRSGLCRLAVAAFLLALPGLIGSSAEAEQRRVFLDGHFDDWGGADPVWVDQAGDGGSSGIDLGAIWAADDQDHLYLRFEVGCNLVAQSGNDLAVYIDGDDNPATGFPISGMGAELRWTFGDREGRFFHESYWTAIGWVDIGLVSGPTHSGWQFEVAIDRDAEPDGTHALFTSSVIRFLLHDLEGSGDWAPDAGTTIEYAFDQGSLDPLETIDLENTAAGALRLVTYNVLFDGLFDYSKQPAFERILQALDPDIIAFQEIYDHNATETRLVIEEFLGGEWMARQVSDKVLLTRGTIQEYWSIAGGRAGAFRLSPFGAFENDLLVINAHLSCCDNDPARQEQVDAIMAFVRDAKTPGGEIDLTDENPIIITGDMNFVGLFRQLETLLTGDIEDEGTYGPDFAPDWDDSDLYDLVSRQPAAAMGYTWYKETSSYSPGRLDFIIYTDSNVSSEKDLLLQTSLLPPSFLDQYGLESDDTDVASDHLPGFSDLLPSNSGAVEWLPDLTPRVRLALQGPNPMRDHVHVTLTLPASGPSAYPVGSSAAVCPGAAPGASGILPEPALLSVYDAAGRLLRILAADRHEAGVHHFDWDGLDGAGRAVPAGTYWIRLATRGDVSERVVLIR